MGFKFITLAQRQFLLGRLNWAVDLPILTAFLTVLIIRIISTLQGLGIWMNAMGLCRRAIMFTLLQILIRSFRAVLSEQ
jgi:hypothetical protein